MPHVCLLPLIQQQKLHNRKQCKVNTARGIYIKNPHTDQFKLPRILLWVWDSSWLPEAKSEVSLCVIKAFPGFWPLNSSWKLHYWVTDAIFRQQFLKVTLKPDLTVLYAPLNFIWQSSFGFRANRSFGGLYKQFDIMLLRVSKSPGFLFWLGSYVRLHQPWR